jgi:hypothetical protein
MSGLFAFQGIIIPAHVPNGEESHPVTFHISRALLLLVPVGRNHNPSLSYY